MKIQVFLPAILLIFAVVCAHFSGNDKASFLVLFVVAINAFIVFVSIFAILLRKISLRSFCILVLPTAYILLVFILVKQGLLDSEIFLGFR